MKEFNTKKETLERHNLFFNQTFGPGTENYCGEDTIFLMEMIKLIEYI